MINFPTAMPAIITPFTANGLIAVEAHASNVSDCTAEGATGIVVAGSTGEGPYLEPGERALLVDTTRKAAPESFIMCGINGESVRQALDQIHEAHGSGADAVLVGTPGTLVRNNDPGVERFYHLVADKAPIPVFLYTVPRVTGYELPVPIIRALASHDNIVGVKDSGGDASRILDLKDAIATGFIVYAGASRALSESHTNGAHGAITASGNYAFGLVLEASSGSSQAQDTLTKLTSVIEAHGVPGTKRAAGLMGRSSCHPRPPLVDVDEAVTAVIQTALDIAKR